MTAHPAPETTPGIGLAELTTMSRAATAFRARHGRRCTTRGGPAGFSVLTTAWTPPAPAGRNTYDKKDGSHFMWMLEGPTA